MSRSGTTAEWFGIATVTAALAMLSAPVSSAGTVVTAANRQNGTIELQPGALKVGNVPVNWADVLLVFNEKRAARDILPPEVLHLRNGEAWAGEIVKLASGQAKISTTFFGQRDVSAGLLRAVDFKSHLPPVREGEGKMLYRTKGSPVPGSLLWIEGDRVALETPLGVLSLTRKEIQRAVFDDITATNDSAGGEDELALTDGTVLIGQVAPGNDGLVVKHAVLGDQVVKPDAWRWVRRHPAQVEYLSDEQPASVQSMPLIRRTPPEPRVESSRGMEDGPVFVRRMHIWPKTTVEYELPGQAGRKVMVSAILGLSAGSRGNASVRIRAGARNVFDSVLKTDAPEPVVVSFETEAGSVLALDVDFDKVVGLPCGVTVDDAFVILK